MIKNCSVMQSTLLTEKMIILFCKDKELLALISLPLTTEVSIRIVTINASIKMWNFLLLNTSLFSPRNIVRYIKGG